MLFVKKKKKIEFINIILNMNKFWNDSSIMITSTCFVVLEIFSMPKGAIFPLKVGLTLPIHAYWMLLSIV